ncbi:MAG: preprotein translocase subunit SecE [Candidatus Blackburnbacteria bacterium RIFCSPHIGHO2_12_FULL_41_13b]|uniref:Protein translocase subunit SecE n=1 Tax=Candidatus Blackburnbacteria bacterium RIFCSPHIGHO2_12_FULL_41_13b TaxID=1797517 RepID=A0A1G1V8Y6_9BACT|nr:MAG: preprotein translocase subunit SecE [Candidatus Blackburnbacteria bacterium RIFCSPHIGHO2_12_FULL_41_13b]
MSYELCFSNVLKMNPFIFLREVKSEMEKVVWPTRNQAIQLTVMVIAVSVLVGAYIGGLDFILTNVLNSIVK